jgi:hypothetical protein
LPEDVFRNPFKLQANQWQANFISYQRPSATWKTSR